MKAGLLENNLRKKKCKKISLKTHAIARGFGNFIP
jgi:hypothetical protein